MTDRLPAGNAVVFYTDGITDLPAPAGRTDRDLHALLAAQPLESAADVVRLLRSDLDARVASTGRADDVAVLVLRNVATADR